jgi:DNA polymerase elongation subunit (family B)
MTKVSFQTPKSIRSSKLEPWCRIMVTFNNPRDKFSDYQNGGQSIPFIRTLFTLGTCAPIPGTTVQSFEDEKDMLIAWHKFFMEVDPDIVTGYNITQFDIHYLLKRACVLKLIRFPYSGRNKCRTLFLHPNID